MAPQEFESPKESTVPEPSLGKENQQAAECEGQPGNLSLALAPASNTKPSEEEALISPGQATPKLRASDASPGSGVFASLVSGAKRLREDKPVSLEISDDDGSEEEGEENKPTIETQEEDSSEEEVGLLEEEAVPSPPKKLSEAAIKAKLRRIFTPRANGSYLVPEDVLEQYKAPNTRPKVLSLFEKVGYNRDRGWGMQLAMVWAGTTLVVGVSDAFGQDKFVKRIQRMYEEVTEQEIHNEYEFMSEADMAEAEFPEPLACKNHHKASQTDPSLNPSHPRKKIKAIKKTCQKKKGWTRTCSVRMLVAPFPRFPEHV